jgi:hypothetical protein
VILGNARRIRSALFPRLPAPKSPLAGSPALELHRPGTRETTAGKANVFIHAEGL